MEAIVVGIDVGGTTTAVGTVTRSGQVLSRRTFATDAAPDFSAYLIQLRQVIDELTGGFTAEVAGIGIGAPAGNHRYGTIHAANLNWGGKVPFVEALSQHYPVPVVLDNDANATAIGEMHFGAAQPYRHFILITLGTGLGSGIVHNGELVYGWDGMAGELGHICVDMNGRDCACGRKGCLETYVSANGLKRTVFELMARRVTSSPLRELGYHALNARRISEAARAGDRIALEAFDYTGKLLGLKLADAVAHTSPEAIIFFGGLANAGELLFEPTRRYLKEYLLFLYNADMPLLPSALPESDAAVLGAAALVWQKLEKEVVQRV
jgi:glucokinase